MKLSAIVPIGVRPEVDAPDLIALADACAAALDHDQAPDRPLLAALRTALEACAVRAATDTPRDSAVPAAGMLAHTRRVWGPVDHAADGVPRLGKRPA